MKENIVIGIEGLVGAGKTSICRELIKIIPNTVVLHGGNLYRAIVYLIIKNKINIEELENIDIKKFMDKYKICLEIENNETVIYAKGKKIDEEELQSKENSMAVSIVGGKANNEKLFEFARNFINNLKENYNVIISGRAIMQIYPNTNYHFFITAALEERIKRKCIQYKSEKEKEEIKDNIIKRDTLQKEAGFYNLHNKTIQIDVTDCKTAKESAIKVLDNIKEFKERTELYGICQ